jgi:hypothetical protein
MVVGEKGFITVRGFTGVVGRVGCREGGDGVRRGSRRAVTNQPALDEASTRTRSSRWEMMSLRTDNGAVGAVSYGRTASIIQVKKLSHAVLFPMPTRTRVVDRGRTTSRTLKGIPSADVVEMNFRRRMGKPLLRYRRRLQWAN